MQLQKRFSATDYIRMSKELELLAETIRHHPEMNHHPAERLRAMAAEMRQDAESEVLKDAP